MSRRVYADTSALAKWYLNEPFSEEFEAFVRKRPGASISTLTLLEMRCLLARRRRAGELDRDTEDRVFSALQADVASGHLELRPIADGHVSMAVLLLSRLPRHALRTLDAIHIAVALDLQAEELASADRVQADAAEALGLHVVRFHG